MDISEKPSETTTAVSTSETGSETGFSLKNYSFDPKRLAQPTLPISLWNKLLRARTHEEARPL